MLVFINFSIFVWIFESSFFTETVTVSEKRQTKTKKTKKKKFYKIQFIVTLSVQRLGLPNFHETLLIMKGIIPIIIIRMTLLQKILLSQNPASLCGWYLFCFCSYIKFIYLLIIPCLIYSIFAIMFISIAILYGSMFIP